MFTPRLGLKISPQKNRHHRLRTLKHSQHFSTWLRVISIGQGFMQPNFLSRLYTWGKKITNQPQTHNKFWVNIQAAVPVTRKPANLRMGKGKGGRASYSAKVNPGSTLLALSWLRRGKIAGLKRKIQVRCNFKITITIPATSIANKFFIFKSSKRSYLFSRMYELRSFFRRSNQSYQYLFVGFLFKWFRLQPYLRSGKAFKVFYLDAVEDFALTPLCNDTLTLFSFWEVVEKEITNFLFEGFNKQDLIIPTPNDVLIEETGSSYSDWYVTLFPETIPETLTEDEIVDVDLLINENLDTSALANILANLPHKNLQNVAKYQILAWQYFLFLFTLNQHLTSLNNLQNSLIYYASST